MSPISFQEYLHHERFWLKRYFSLGELLRSDMAFDKNIPNIPDINQVALLNEFTKKLLNPLREVWGAPLMVESCFREPALNKLLGGSDTSDHLFDVGGAADLVPTDNSQKGLMEFMGFIAQCSVPFDQAIIYPSFVHVGWRLDCNRRELRKMFLDANGKKAWPFLNSAELAAIGA